LKFDILIKNGKIVDGAGNPGYFAEISIKNGKFVRIGAKIIEKNVNRVIDASGMVVCPGFIDMHSHTDSILPIYSGMDAAVHQGITTAVVGMCGSSLAPVPSDKIEIFKELFKIPTVGFVPITWSSYSEYLDEMDRLRVPPNLIFVVGFETIRIAGGSGFEDRSPTSEELKRMKQYVAEAMEAGAFGISTGLIYAPQIFAKTEEIIELAKIVGDYGGLYFSHIRDEGNKLESAVREFIEIVEKSGCSGGQIAHFKASGKRNWGKSEESLRLVSEANEKGISITVDQYPFNRGQSSLVTALPPWAREGDNEKILDRLEDPAIREKIKQVLSEETDTWENWIKINGFENIYPTFYQNIKWKELEGKSITEFSNKNGYKDVWEAFFDIM
jgi:N-acyl-D-amino-acid deacylase